MATTKPASHHLPVYPEYKPSGVDCIQQIPNHWNILKLKYVATANFSNVDKHTIDNEKAVRLCNYVDVYYNNVITPDLKLMEATATHSEIAKFTLKKGDVIVTKDSEAWDDIAVPAYVPSDLQGVLCGYHLAQIRPNPDVVDGKYLFISFCSREINDQFRVAANGVTRFGLGKYWLDNGMFVVPPIDEQRAIADFLDRETERIDGLIARKERQIEILQEKRAALISHAVTKGLDAGVKMKPSGIEWLGDIPKHWEMVRLKHVSPKQSVGLVINPSTYVDPNGNIPFLFGADIDDFEIQTENARRITEESNRIIQQSILNSGDLVTVRVGYPGTTAVIPPELHGCNCASMMVIRQPKKCSSNWLCYVMNSTVGRSQVEIVQYGAAQKQFNISHAVEFRIPIPPLAEQKNIIQYLEIKRKSILRIEKKVKTSIECLQEYRTALISAAVTGKIDVRKEVSCQQTTEK